MSLDVSPVILAFAGVVVLSYAVQTVTGFGSMLLCVTLGAHLLPIRDVVTLAVPVSLLQTGYIAVRHAGSIRWRLLLTRVLPLMGAGMAVGFFALGDLESAWLRVVFVLMVLFLAARELWGLVRARRGPTARSRPIPPVAGVGAMLGAGVIHGVYATGGPLLVYALGRSGLTKSEFRSTLAVVWSVLNVALGIGFAAEGRYEPSDGVDLALLGLAIPLGVVVGEAVHRRVDEHRFKILVFALLVAAALALLAR